MESYNYLLVEDSDEDASVCKDTVARMNEERSDFSIVIEVASDLATALSMLNKTYDGAIIDIKLGDHDSGNEVIKEITEKYRIPVSVMTGTPDTILEEDSPIRIYKKGEVTYEDIITALVDTSRTGLFKVIGGKGILEETMKRVFWKNLYPKVETWKKLKEQGNDTEAILLRYAIAHIQELLEDTPFYSREEVYIAPPLTEKIRTGCIVKNKHDNLYYVVLSPPCDLAIHNGEMKTDRVMLCEIDDYRAVSLATIGDTGAAKRKKALLPTIKNNGKEYYHWLPKNSVFEGGFINFRKVINYSPQELGDEFHSPELRIQDAIVKDILGRFSSYYARQGQPDFDFDFEAQSIIDTLYTQTSELKGS
ncbi:response regulator [Paenibacillus kribbensis]|uniref:response regulator n=1 Tax=Paenibacillus kribbensis TaxID=172713 RepID=UPI0015BD85BA|nr:response regulator [Paenibacillus kribbensis]